MEPTLIVATPEQLQAIIRSTIKEMFEQKSRDAPVEYYTINQVAKKLKSSHATITKYIEQGMIKTTKDRRISDDEIKKFINNQ